MPTRTPVQSSEVAAFAAALDDFRRASARARGRLASEGDLTLSQYHLLEPLLTAPAPLGVGELACAAGVSAPTATRMLAGLEREALVERRACTRDRRGVRVALTTEGADGGGGGHGRRGWRAGAPHAGGGGAQGAKARPLGAPPGGAVPLARAAGARARRPPARPAQRRDRGAAMSEPTARPPRLVNP